MVPKAESLVVDYGCSDGTSKIAVSLGARHPSPHPSRLRCANQLYNRLASLMTGFNIEDLTSGFRAGFPVAYVPIHAGRRTSDSKSHIRLLRDGVRFFIIILKIGALFSPMRLFLPVSGLIFATGLGYYGYTYWAWHKLTNMPVILFLGSLFVFMRGIVSEQISALHYRFHNEQE